MRLGGPWAWLLGLPTAVVYGSLALFVSVLHNVFLLYYVDTFVSVYKIDKAAFWVGEVGQHWGSQPGWEPGRWQGSVPPIQEQRTVFLLWNSLNDPLFGWLSDRRFLSSQPRFCPYWLQVFHCHFNSNFFPLFLEHLLSDHISLSTGSFLLGISYVAPHLNNLYFLPLCRRWGVYAVVRGLFLLKLGLSLLMLLAGPDHPGLLCLFIASNRVFTEGTCKLLTLVVTDLVDEDLVLNHRKQAASALLFGMVALVTKPGQTFAPLLGTWLLCFYTGHDLFQQPPLAPVGSAQPWPEPPAPPPAQAPTLRQGCFYLLVLVPITCALLQLFTWSQFTLHGRRLHMVKAQRQNLSRAQTLDVKVV
ncbi:MFSD13A [Cervus elaphus hippelaphus]|uniref:MFSD13A n=1 Tax=Cervus elaphus hippelaphus TaxID=46360 RepID=A0A212CP62_CEREH|nr:MFSD13A [Cervus elaphus hippelaphus]